MYERRRVIIVLAITVLLLVSVVLVVAFPDSKPPHAPISIVGDASLSQADGDVRGDGSPQSPYVVEGWDIRAPSNGSGIYVRGTNAHLVIRNVDIHSNGSAWFGVCLEYARNVTLENVRMTGSWNGIRMNHCLNVGIHDCDISSNLYGGIEISRSENISVTESRAGDTHLHNQWVSISSVCNISGNEFRPGDEKWRACDNHVGIEQCANITFSANVMNDCDLQVWNCTGCSLSQNEFSGTCVRLVEIFGGAFVKNEMMHNSYLEMWNCVGMTVDRDYPSGPPGP